MKPSAFGTGFIEEIDLQKNRVIVKLENGQKQILNPQEIERSTSLGPPKEVSKTVTTTQTTGGVVKVVKSVTTTTTGKS